MNPYRDPAPYAVGDSVDFDPDKAAVDGFHLPFGTFRIQAIREDGWVFVANGWSDPFILRRPRPHPV